MDTVIGFLVSTAGRITRVIAGLALVTLGLLGMGDSGGLILSIIGLVPLLAGLFDVCVFAPLFGFSFYGTKVREGMRSAH
jgi:hypothetical protein